MSAKNRATLNKFATKKIIAHFLRTPRRVMARLAMIEELSLNDAIQMQLAAAMAILIPVMLRIHNLKQIRIDGVRQMLGHRKIPQCGFTPAWRGMPHSKSLTM